MKNFSIYVAFHRDGKIVPEDNLYKAIQVGKKSSRLELEIINDAEGENISDRNNIYSELTGWYWVWKNAQHDFVGTSHYRRYFTLEQMSFVRRIAKLILIFVGQKKKRHGLFQVNSAKRWRNRILGMDQAKILMEQFDALLPVKKKFPYTVYEQYKRRHKEEDIILTRKIIEEKQPGYLADFDRTFRSNEIYPFNMFVLPWKLFDDYMNWLFPVLFELEKRSEIDFNDNYQKRVCAFMAERLQTVWFNHNKIKVKELNVLYFKKNKAVHF
ncbi:MAG: exopolysaccharide biosynthesis [Prolixibacteraceae bacterium]|nr:MAG: exopolysaccharide biosynthesis [Prolixibacteraceae bacterium]